MYTQEKYREFGYKKDSTVEFKYNMQENMKYGRFCKSGIALIIEAESKMVCVELETVKTNLDSFTSVRDSPYECKIHDGAGKIAEFFDTAC